MNLRLTPDEMARACFLWEQKGFDTKQIAADLSVCESVVYRSLAERRDERFRMRAIAKRMVG